MEASALAPSGCAHLWRPRELDAYLGAYDIGTVQSSAELAGGMFLRPLLIRTDRGSYVLRGHSFRGNARSFRFQAEVIAGAADRGVRCPRIVRRKDGRWGAPLDGAYCALHEYAPGHVLDWRTWAARKRDCPDFLRRLGEHVAALHNALDRMIVGGSPGLSLARGSV